MFNDGESSPFNVKRNGRRDPEDEEDRLLTKRTRKIMGRCEESDNSEDNDSSGPARQKLARDHNKPSKRNNLRDNLF